MSIFQIFSWISLLFSLYLAISGFSLLGFKQAVDNPRSNELVESGIYGKVRHPLYSSLFFLALGAFLKEPALFSAILLFGTIFTLLSTIGAEEKVDEDKFGPQYLEYKRKTKMFIPYVY